VENKNAKDLAAALEKQGIKTDARGEYLRICPDYLNSRAELEPAAGQISLLLPTLSATLPGSS
jgi:hypothetical protein